MTFYDYSPISIQNIAFSLAGAKILKTRYGKGFLSKLNVFNSHLNWSHEQLSDWRDVRLRRLIQHAYSTVPYYRRVMDEGGINPSSIKSLEDLKKLPLLTKDMIKANPNDFFSTQKKENAFTSRPYQWNNRF